MLNTRCVEAARREVFGLFHGGGPRAAGAGRRTERAHGGDRQLRRHLRPLHDPALDPLLRQGRGRAEDLGRPHQRRPVPGLLPRQLHLGPGRRPARPERRRAGAHGRRRRLLRPDGRVHGRAVALRGPRAHGLLRLLGPGRDAHLQGRARAARRRVQGQVPRRRAAGADLRARQRRPPRHAGLGLPLLRRRGGRGGGGGAPRLRAARPGGARGRGQGARGRRRRRPPAPDTARGAAPPGGTFRRVRFRLAFGRAASSRRARDATAARGRRRRSRARAPTSRGVDPPAQATAPRSSRRSSATRTTARPSSSTAPSASRSTASTRCST